MKINTIEQIHQLLPKKIIPRHLFRQIIADCKKPEIQILYGPRQVGKRTISPA